MNENNEKRSQLLRKVGKYTAAAGAVLLTGNLANAAVHFTPSTINLTPGSYGIDFDGDGDFELIMDVSSSSYYSYFSGVRIILELGSDADATSFEVIQGGPFGTNYDVAAFPLNRIIGPTLASSSSYWRNENVDTIVSTVSGSFNDGNFGYYPLQTRYAGVRFTSDGGTNWHYAWIGININNTPLLGTGSAGQIVGFAYETTPNQSILAGSGATVPLAPLASAVGLGLVGLFGFFKSRRKKANS